MPNYDFACQCGYTDNDRVVPMKECDSQVCPQCGKTLAIQIGPTQFAMDLRDHRYIKPIINGQVVSGAQGKWH
jgi:putative FmdB family regulatory protein